MESILNFEYDLTQNECVCEDCFYEYYDENLSKCPPITQRVVVQGIGVVKCLGWRNSNG